MFSIYGIIIIDKWERELIKMLNSFASSSSNSNSSASVSNVGNTINISPIIRTNAETKFKKVKIDSLEFDLMVSDTPSIVNEQITRLECKDSYTNLYEYSIQEIQILSFNPIQIDTMLVEYLLIGEPKKQELEVRNYRHNCFSKNEIFKRILEKRIDYNSYVWYN